LHSGIRVVQHSRSRDHVNRRGDLALVLDINAIIENLA
jgi:hypothetical protein